MSSWFQAVCALLALAPALVACRGGEKKSGVRCEVTDRSVREVSGGALEVAVSVRWSIGGKNYRTNKPIAIGRFDPKDSPRAALEERFKPGSEVACSVDPARPTRVDLREP